MVNFFLIGYMGSGKTTVGKKLAAKLNFEFIDLDKLNDILYNDKREAFSKHQVWLLLNYHPELVVEIGMDIANEERMLWIV